MSKPYIRLNAGDPDVEAPQVAIDAAIESIKKGGGYTHYTHWLNETLPGDFKQAVVDYYKKWIGTQYKTENVIPVAGSSAALYLAITSCLKEGDEVICFEPSYASHYTMFRDMGIKMSVGTLRRENKYHLDIDKLPELVSKKTKAIILCNPNNPTGTVFTKEEVKAVGDLAVDKDLAIISDEIYLHYVYDNNKFVAPSTFPDLTDRTINIMSFSKTFSMTGWRLGYVIAPQKYLTKAQTMMRLAAPRPPTFLYPAGTACLKSDFKYVEERRKEYDARRKYFCKAVDDMGYPCHMFEGAFYAWFDARKTKMGSDQFVEKLKKDENLELSPGAMFGFHQDGFIRVPLTQPIPVLKDAVDRLKTWSKKL